MRFADLISSDPPTQSPTRTAIGPVTNSTAQQNRVFRKMTFKNHFRILVATIDKNKVEKIKNAFEHLDCQIIPAPSMSLALFLTQKNLPDLIFSDLELTDGDGWSYLHEVRQEPELAGIPFIFLADKETANLTLEQALEIGATSLLDNKISDATLVDLTMPILKERLLAKGKRPEETPE